MRCPACQQGWDDCHGLLIAHDDGSVECLDGDCADVDRARHHWALPCIETFHDGCCAPPVLPQRRVA